MPRISTIAQIDDCLHCIMLASQRKCVRCNKEIEKYELFFVEHIVKRKYFSLTFN